MEIEKTIQVNGVVSVDAIAREIIIVRDTKVMLDSSLAELYGVSVKYLNKAVKRNIKRFPDDFMFQLSKEEAEASRFQIGTLKGRGSNIKYLPYVFSEFGVAMLSSVLRSEIAIAINIFIMRAFIHYRELLPTHKAIAVKLDEIEKHTIIHGDNIKCLFQMLRSHILNHGCREEKDK